jgi:hypothetical protein
VLKHATALVEHIKATEAGRSPAEGMDIQFEVRSGLLQTGLPQPHCQQAAAACSGAVHAESRRRTRRASSHHLARITSPRTSPSTHFFPNKTQQLELSLSDMLLEGLMGIDLRDVNRLEVGFEAGRLKWGLRAPPDLGCRLKGCSGMGIKVSGPEIGLTV